MPRSGGKSDAKSGSNKIGVNEENATGGDGGGNPDVVILEETLEEHTCRTCQGPDTDEMVQCDVCDGWHHISCVGVSDEVADKSWSCTNCVTAKWVQRTKPASEGGQERKDDKQDQLIGKIVTSTRGNPVISSTRASQKSAKSLTVPSSSQQPAPLDSVLEQQKQHSPTPSVGVLEIGSGYRSAPTSQKSAKSLTVTSASKKQAFPDPISSQHKKKSSLPAAELPMIDAVETLSDISISSSQKSARNRAKLQLMRLQEERAFQQQQEERRRPAEEKAAQEYNEYLNNKYKILEDLASEEGSSMSSNFSCCRVEEWVETLNPTPIEAAKSAAQKQAREEENLQEQQRQEQLQQEHLREQHHQERLRQEAALQQRQQQQRLYAEKLRQQQQNQLKREQQFRQHQQEQRQEQLRQENLLRQQQEELQKEADTINRMREQQLEQERSLREQQQQFSNRSTGQKVMWRPGNLIHSNQMLETQLNPPNVNQEADADERRESIRGRSGRFIPDELPQSTQLHSRESDYPRGPAANPTDRHSRRSSAKSSIAEDYDQFQLSHSQIAARQAVSKDLPTFSGSPEEWPVFISMYNRTTMMCGFTEDENIVRLQKSLKGRAYDAVKCRLMHSGNVPGILATLKMLFGQPEVIIQSLIGKVGSLTPIREDRLETLVDFAVNVQNFCATVDACGLQEYMYNVTLLHQLVGKLPPSLKLNWAQHRLTLSTVNLATFSEWIYALAEAASVVVFTPTTHDGKPTQNDARGSKKENAYLNAHSETFLRKESYSSDSEEQTAVASTSAEEACPICKRSCKSADKCKRFLELSRDSRWAAVREFGYCRTCLRIHKGYCKAKPCGKDGCIYRHHELLHNDSKQKPKSAAVTTAGREQSPKPSTSQSGCNTHQTTVSSVLFRYLPVVLYGNKRAICTYAFLDEGSALTLLDQELANELQLDGAVSPLCLRWTGGTERHEADSRICNLHVAGIKNENKKFLMGDVRTVKELLLPHQTMDMAELSLLYPHLRDLPIESYRDARPRILIGMKHAQLCLGLKNREGEIGQPIAVKTRLGWTVCGGWTSENEASLHHYTFHVGCTPLGINTVKSNEELHQAMKVCFSPSVAKSEKALLFVKDERALSTRRSLTHRKDHQYESGLPWRYSDTCSPDSRSMALRRFQCLKKRMEKHPEPTKTPQARIAEYVEKGCIRKLNDEEIDDDDADDAYGKWHLWLQVLQQVEQVRVPRCYNSEYPAEKADNIQLHMMVDASEKDMVTICYLRFINDGTIICSIVGAKPKITPRKFTSTPRIELAAAVLDTRLARTIEELLPIRICRMLYWVDSRAFLCWINLDHRRYSQYVGHRISEIIEISEAHGFWWMPSKLSCVNDATKWSKLPDMSANHRWFTGTYFPWSRDEDWPPLPTLSRSTENELHTSFLALHIPSELVIFTSNYSSWKRLVKVAALVQRLAKNCLLKHDRRPIRTGPPTENDLLIAECSLIRFAQRETYPDKIASLQKASRGSDFITNTDLETISLYLLTSWLHERGIMRLRTRIAACNYATEDLKQPVIHQRNHHTTTLIVAYYHHNKYHYQKHEIHYLPEKTRRTKWLARTKPIVVGDIVFIVDPSMAHNCWSKGKVISTKVTHYGQVRSTILRTASCVYWCRNQARNWKNWTSGATESMPTRGWRTLGGVLAALA